ncbi:MAG TPA: hypothetical protein VE127_07865, partial [Solirubrobacteraceae bacterium]|nr:hypothetical protein [Solirubrobacteraceae bacterium]
LVAAGLGLVTPISWGDIGLVWGYCLAWIFIEDQFKLHVYRHLDLAGHRHSRFLDRLTEPLHPAGTR